MIVALHNSGVDAAHIDPRRDRRILRMLSIDFDLAAKSGEFSVGGTEKLMDRKSDGRMRLIEFIGFVPQRGRTQNSKSCCNNS